MIDESPVNIDWAQPELPTTARQIVTVRLMARERIRSFISYLIAESIVTCPEPKWQREHHRTGHQATERRSVGGALLP